VKLLGENETKMESGKVEKLSLKIEKRETLSLFLFVQDGRK